MTNEQEKISELEQRVLALTADKNELQILNTSLNNQLEELESKNQQLTLELRFANLKTPTTSLHSTKPLLNRPELEKNVLIIFLLITLAGTLLLK